MSWGFGGLNNAAQGTGGGSNAQAGPELALVETEILGFRPLAETGSLKLLPSPWPSDAPPPVSASLLSIAPNQGLLAAASPDALILASTERVREAIKADGAGDGQLKSFTPQATIPIPRVSHVTFTADENYLVVAAEQGGGLAVYEVQSLVNGGKEPAFQLSTNSVSIRHLIPSPARSTSDQVAIVLSTGILLLANLQSRALVPNSQGQPVFAENVCTTAWSRLGKQLVCGMSDGSCKQIATDGGVKAEIPSPPQLPSQMACTSIFWLDTLVFLTIHGPVEVSDADMPEPPTWHLVIRDKTTGSAEFRALQDPVPALPDARLPPHHYLQRLREWAPGLDDCLLLACSGCADLGLITKAKEPLQPHHDQVASTVNQYTYTTTLDTKRASMPMSALSSPDSMDSGGETYPLGLSLDASVTELIPAPIPGEDGVNQSSKPVPLMMALNHEGIVQAWWLIYDPSIRQGTPFPGSVAAGLGEQGTFQQNVSGKPGVAQGFPQAISQPGPAATPGASLFGGSKPAGPAFGQAGGGAFGTPATPTPAFGGASMLGQKASPWGNARPQKPAFGQSTFGQNSSGQTGGQVPAPPPSGGTAFLQPAATFGGGLSSGGGFAALGAKNGFSSAPSQSKPTSSLFGMGTATNQGSNSPFANIGSPTQSSGFNFGELGKSNDQQSKPTSSLFGAPKQEMSFGSTATLGSGSGGSTIGINTPAVGGGSFGKPSVSREETMEDDKPTDKNQESILGGPKTGFDFTKFKLGSTFKGDGSAKDDLPKPKDGGAAAFSSMFGSSLPGVAESSGPKIKKEPGKDEPKLEDIPEASAEDAPLPPDPTSATAKAALRAIESDAPLPPDPTTAKAKSALRALDKDSPFAAKPPAKEESNKSEPPIAGSPPLDLGTEQFSPNASASEAATGSVVGSEEAGPAEDDDSADFAEEGWEDEAEDEESDYDEDEDDVDSRRELTEDRKQKLAALESRITLASPKETASRSQETTTPETSKKPESEGSDMRKSYTPAGLPAGMQPGVTQEQSDVSRRMARPPVNFQPILTDAAPNPMSPSPTRASARPGNRNVTSPSRLGNSYQTASKQQALQPPVSQTSPVRFAPSKETSRGGVEATQQKTKGGVAGDPLSPAEPEIGDPVHEEVMHRLQQDPTKSHHVPPFLAHSNHVGTSEMKGLLGNLEKVYRDINSMIDMLGLNAHQLSGFVEHHVGSTKDGGRDRIDLGFQSEWCLEEVADLDVLQREIETQLEEGRLDDVQRRLLETIDGQEEISQVRRKAMEVRSQLRHNEPSETRKKQLLQPLPAEAAAQQAEIREGMKKVQALLAQVENKLGQFRAELGSVTAGKTRPNGRPGPTVPTVESVENTIRKMTAMIEKKSADVDVLASQIKRLPPSAMNSLASLRLNGSYEDDLVSAMGTSRLLTSSAREDSNSVTPQASISRKRLTAQGDPLGMSGMLGSRFRTPPSASTRNSMRFDPTASTMSFDGSGSGRKKMIDVTSEEAEAYEKKVNQRAAVFSRLKKRVESEQ